MQTSNLPKQHHFGMGAFQKCCLITSLMWTDLNLDHCWKEDPSIFSFVPVLVVLLLYTELTLETNLAGKHSQPKWQGRKQFSACLSNCIWNGNSGSSYKNVLLGLSTYYQFCIIKCYAFLAWYNCSRLHTWTVNYFIFKTEIMEQENNIPTCLLLELTYHGNLLVW